MPRHLSITPCHAIHPQVGPYGDYLHFPYPGGEGLVLVPEVDCVRIGR